MLRTFPIVSLFLLIMAASEAGAQRTPGPGTVSVSGRVGGRSYDASGAGSCRHSPSASIYDVPAALWMVEHASSGDGASKRVNLTVWRPKDGSSDQISLSLETGSSSHHISSGGKAKPVGTATVKLSLLGSGGRFELQGKDADGIKVELTVTCPGFTGIEAEGG